MSRSGYVDDYDHMNLYRANVDRAIAGKRGQSFLKELAVALDEMPEKKLIAEELINSEGQCCTIGVVCKARQIDVSKIDYTDPQSVSKVMGISSAMAAEIEYENDEARSDKTPEDRWNRMRKWVAENLKEKK